MDSPSVQAGVSNGRKRRFPIGKLVEVSVGGQVYATTLDTLCKEKDSMLAAMFSGTFALTETREGHYFIDRDGSRFRHVLNYLRSGTVYFPSENAIQMCDELLEEANYFGLQGLKQLIEERREQEVTKADQMVDDKLEVLARATRCMQAITGALYTKGDLELQRIHISGNNYLPTASLEEGRHPVHQRIFTTNAEF